MKNQAFTFAIDTSKRLCSIEDFQYQHIFNVYTSSLGNITVDGRARNFFVTQKIRPSDF